MRIADVAQAAPLGNQAALAASEMAAALLGQATSLAGGPWGAPCSAQHASYPEETSHAGVAACLLPAATTPTQHIPHLCEFHTTCACYLLLNAAILSAVTIMI